ncbi:MarR family transcriptional regulator [Mycobacterium sp.]|uniref:MarR family winged helix-turn-helix transcriptional regulator n=1 Tax=Mycobacterium sp. TaxID=1785 RepID=UPI0025D66DCA|nr:MarR family transcriptional regulator [Mycobacterium sp.]
MSAHNATESPAAIGGTDDKASSLDERGVFLLSQLGFHVATRCGELLAPLGLQPPHYGVLMHLATNEGVSQQQLADAMGVHRNVMVGLIDDLEARDLVRRDRDPYDRRAHQLRLTDRAHAVLADANTAVDGLEEEIMAGLRPRERDRFIALLHHATRRAQLPVGIHPGLRRVRRTNTP